VILLSLPGCAALREMEKRREVRKNLISAQELLGRRDYLGSLKESQKALSLSAHVPPAGEALFNTGLVYAHFGHAKRDYKKSIGIFRRVLNEFPQSHFAGRAAIWIDVLQDNERSRGEIEELNRSVRECRQENQRLSKEIEELNKTIDTSKQIDIEIDAKKKELSK
jgi:tetratricopeptide (TPR) repeat protein